MTVTVLDSAGAIVAELESRRWRRAGPRTVVFDGKGLPDGAYVVHVAANATGGREATVDVPVTVTRTLGRVQLDTEAMTPNGDGRGDALAITVPLTVPATVTVKILREGRWVATPFTGAAEPGERIVTWDGRKRLGKARDGSYVVSVEASDGVATAKAEVPFLLDATAPTVRVVSAEPPRVWVSEAATLRVRVNGVRRTIRGCRLRERTGSRVSSACGRSSSRPGTPRGTSPCSGADGRDRQPSPVHSPRDAHPALRA